MWICFTCIFFLDKLNGWFYVIHFFFFYRNLLFLIYLFHVTVFNLPIYHLCILSFRLTDPKHLNFKSFFSLLLVLFILHVTVLYSIIPHKSTVKHSFKFYHLDGCFQFFSVNALLPLTYWLLIASLFIISVIYFFMFSNLQIYFLHPLLQNKLYLNILIYNSST